MRCFAAFAVRDQRGGGAPTASSAEGNSPVSIASISRKYLWFGKPQLRDSGVTIALCHHIAEKPKRALIRVKVPKGRPGSPRLLFLGPYCRRGVASSVWDI